MKVAIPCTEQDEVFPSFDQAGQFAVYDYTQGDFVDKRVFGVKSNIPEQVAYLLRYLGVEVIVCGNISEAALAVMAKYRLPVYSGVEGSTDKAYYDLVNDRLKATAKSMCSIRDRLCSGKGNCNCGRCG